MAVNPDYRDLLSAFAAREVRYLVVGGYALAFHSRPRFTKDLDVWVDPAPDNAGRAWAALAEFGAPMGQVAAGDLASPELILQIGVAPNRIDVLTALEGLDFPSAWSRRVETIYGGVPVPVLSKADLIRNKRAVGRPQDLLDADALEGDESAP